MDDDDDDDDDAWLVTGVVPRRAGRVKREESADGRVENGRRPKTVNSERTQ